MVLEPHLNKGVTEVVRHQDHDEDRNRNTEISDDPPQLKDGWINVFTQHRTEIPIRVADARLLTLPGKKALFLNLRR